MTFRLGENEIEIDFLLMQKEHRQLLKNVKAIHGEFHHELVVADNNR